MANLQNFDNLELIRVAKDIADQKGLNLDVIIRAIEEAIQLTSRSRYGNCKIKVTVDKKTGLISTYRQVLVISDNGEVVIPEGKENEIDHADVNKYKLITLTEAKQIDENAKLGDIMLEPLPVIDLDYSSAKIAKQKIAQVIVLEERKKQYESFKDRIGDIVYGTAKRIEYNNVIVDLNGNEGYLSASNLIKGEVFRVGDRVKAHIEDVRKENSGPQIFLSRVNKGFMEQLFKQEIPEIYDGIVTIKAIARDPGSRSKVAVFSSDKNIDPVGACVGARGVRIQSIIAELHGEKIDVVLYSPELPKFIVNAIAPAEVLKVIIDEDKEKVELIIPENQLSLAIGRYGQNIRLASELVNWKIDVIGDETESTRKAKELTVGSRIFVEGLDVEEIIGQLLFTEGFVSIEDIDQASVSDISAIDGFNEEIAIELKNRASDYLTRKDAEIKQILESLPIDKDVAVLPFLKPSDIIALSESGINNLEDIAGLCTDEFYEIVPNVALTKDQIDSIILESRRKIGWL
ncbi:transcription elongation factor NusA [Ehrlichia ruminantium]|uniref:transcription termination factor NusA n=1 Tax=Ehrlichia ruminantium TaxID=779 RepID=UPI0007C1141F|nr:transcription termination factor NusA [Ehrlichia ruminantium]QLK52396.1 transcription termination/antitermination protein NusA [Ehrlichia ruminantium]QLK54226.1 transcription termination/antitermination protein NusA [Ehrlichia ruminantium]QLK56978.1 transcription termination/antitermination protein NusA [Ehrlichia ruminantium]QLK57892.1 transcription termination/antitermination protein NusA [Ehrlichia ruminantium]UOD97469.1 transcription termination/antitermination protein NusA [Ehrlichia r